MENIEVKLNPGSILRFNLAKVVDQLSDEGTLVKVKELDSYLKDKYNLTVEEYYNLVVNGDKDYRPKCPCGAILRFNRGNFNNPYKQYCSTQCGNKYRIPEVLIDNEYLSKLSDLDKDYISKNRLTVTIGSTVYNIYGYGKYIHPDYDTQSNWYFDQLSGVGVYERGFKSYLKDTYNLTEQEYYNLVVFGDKDYETLCRYCGKPTTFLNFRYGYHAYCNTSHQALHQRSLGVHPFQNDDLISQNREKLINGTHNMNSLKVISKRCKSEFVNRCNKFNHTLAQLYLATYKDSSDVFKVGITTRTTLDRMNNGKCRNKGTYKSIHLIKEGSPELISSMEMDIKLKYSEKVFSTEDIRYEHLSEVLNLIRNYKSA